MWFDQKDKSGQNREWHSRNKSSSSSRSRFNDWGRESNSHMMTRHQPAPHPQAFGGGLSRHRKGTTGHSCGRRGPGIGDGGGGSRKGVRVGASVVMRVRMRARMRVRARVRMRVCVRARVGVGVIVMMASVGPRSGGPRRRRCGRQVGILPHCNSHVLRHGNHAAATDTSRCTAARSRVSRRRHRPVVTGVIPVAVRVVAAIVTVRARRDRRRRGCCGRRNRH